MNPVLWFVIAAVALVPLPAQQPKPKVTGKVTHALTGAPIPKVVIHLRAIAGGNTGRSTTTDAEGKFLFDDVAVGQYRLGAEKTGFVPGSFGSRSMSAPGTIVNVKDSGVLSLDFTLHPQAVLTGRVVDEDGDPIQGALVQVARYRTMRGVRQLLPMNGTSSNDLGEFRIPNLPAGTYYLIAQARGRFDGNALGAGSKSSYTQTYFPSAIDAASATPLPLKAGQEISQLQIQLRKTPVYTVRGRIEGVTAPLAGYNLQLLRRGESGMRGFNMSTSIRRLNESDFEIHNVVPGQYDLALLKMQGRPVFLARTPVSIGNADLDNVILTAQPPLEVKGRIRFDAESTVALTGTRLQINGRSLGSGFGEATVNAEGGFKFSDVAREEMMLSLRPPAGTYVKQVLLGGQDVTQDGLNFATGTAEMEIVLGTKPASFTGSVKRENPEQAPGIVWILGKDVDPARIGMPARVGMVPYVSADQTGQFNLKDLPPGEYQLLAAEEMTSGFSAEEWRKLSSKAKLLMVKEGQNSSIILDQVSRTELLNAGVDLNQ